MNRSVFRRRFQASGVLFLASCAVVLVALITPAGAVEVQRVTGGGVEAWLVEDHSIPIISVDFAFRGGAALDPQDKAGLARFTMALLDEGAGDLDSQAFQARLEALAVELSFHATRDTVGGDMRTLSANRDAAFDLLRLALSEPRFDAEPVARVRSQIEAHLRQSAEDPGDLASRRFFAAAYPDHPYGQPVDGTLETIAAVTVDDLRTFAARRIARSNLIIGVVGDITAAQLEALLQSTFAPLPEQAAPDTVPDAAPEPGGSVIVIDQAVPQSVILFGQRGVKRDDPQFYAATVLNHILGGGSFTSRLYEEVRELRGLAYSVSTDLYPLDHSGLLNGGAATANARAAETIAIVQDEWRRMAENGVTEDELNDAKTYLTGSFPLRFTNSGSIAGMLVGMQLYDLGIDYIDRRNDLIEAVSLDDVNRLAGTLLTPDRLLFVVAGRPDGLDATN